MKSPLNVLFITADQWRGDCLGSLGHPCVQTPHLDRLARDGTVFRQHYSQASPCGPGRASLYTGLYLHNHRVVVNGTPLDQRHTNVALEVRRLGLDPVLFGYTDVGPDPRGRDPRDPALRTHEGPLPGMTAVVSDGGELLFWRAHLKRRGYAVGPGEFDVYRPRAGFPGSEGRGRTFSPAFFAAEDSNTAFLTDEVIRYLSVRQAQPWFVHLSYLSPHPPFVVPEPYHAMYAPADVPRPVRAASAQDEARQHPYLATLLDNQRGTGIFYGHKSRNNLQLSETDILQARATYFAMMTEVDANIGRLIDFLEQTGAYERTLFVFTSDHGEQLGDHWLFVKYAYFDQSFHIPLIIRDPRTPGATQTGAFTENVDVMPTILECLGLDVPVPCDGESLRPFLLGEHPSTWRDEVHWALDFRDFSLDGTNPVLGLTPDQCTLSVIRSRQRKYVHFTALPALFFDLETDSAELHDRSTDPAYRAEMLEYTQKMLSWRMLHDERTLTNTLLTPDGIVRRRHPRR